MTETHQTATSIPDDPRTADGIEHRGGDDHDRLGRVTGRVATDHLSRVPRRRSDGDREHDGDELHRHRPRPRVLAHLRGRCGRQPEEPGEPAEPTAAAITVSASSAIFSDTFSSASFAAWTGATSLTIDAGAGGAAPPSAKAQATTSQAFAYKLSGHVLHGVHERERERHLAGTDHPTLFRLRTAANGPIARVYPNSTGILSFGPTSRRSEYSGAALGTGWHTIQLCGTVGASGTWDLYLDVPEKVAAWVANTGTTPVGRVDIGNNGRRPRPSTSTTFRWSVRRSRNRRVRTS